MRDIELVGVIINRVLRLVCTLKGVNMIQIETFCLAIDLTLTALLPFGAFILQGRYS